MLFHRPQADVLDVVICRNYCSNRVRSSTLAVLLVWWSAPGFAETEVFRGYGPRAEQAAFPEMREICMLAGRITTLEFSADTMHERNLFLIYVVLIWAVTIAGFGLEMSSKFAEGTLHYPLIVHAHAVVYISWLMLFSAQVVLVRRGHRPVHRRLGLVSIAMISLLAIVAIATVIVTKTLKYGHPDTSFPFMSVQFTNVLASTILFSAGVWLRRSPSTHKRLMLMGTLVLTEPGIRRVVSYLLNGKFDDGFASFIVETYAGTVVLMLGLAAYDLVTRRRLHPAYLVALAWCAANQLAATWLFYQPWWSTYTTDLVSH